MVKVTAERIPDSQVLLNIEVEPERIEKSVEKAYRKLAGQVNIPGFRRGKAPRHIVERFVGKETLFQEGLEQLLGEVYREAVEQTDIHPVDQPELDLEPKPTDLKPGDALVVKATVPVQPTVELGDYHSIRVPWVDVEVSADEVNKIVERIQDQETQWVPVERPVAEGDRVTMDIRGEVGTYAQLYSSTGEPLVQSAGGKDIINEAETEFEVSKESKRYPVNVAEQLLGMTAGQEKQFEASLPADYPDPELANLAVIFHLKVRDVKEKRIPPVDDELAKAVGYESLEEMREDLKKRAQASAEARAREVYELAIVDQAIAISNIEIPPSIVNHEIDHLVERAKDNLKRSRIDLEDYLRITQKSEAELREEFRDQAVRNVKSALVLEKIADEESVTVQPEEIEREIELMSMLVGSQADRLRQSLSSPEQRDSLEYRLRHRKVVGLLESIAKTVEGAEAEATAGEAATAETIEQPSAESAEDESAAARPATDETAATEASPAATELDKE